MSPIRKASYGPVISGISPSSGTTAGGTPITISGRFFLGATNASLGNNVTSLVVVNDTTITGNTAAHSAGAISISVTTPVMTTTTSGFFTYITPIVHSISSVSPNTIYEFTVTSIDIYGSGLTGADYVIANGYNCTSVFVVTDGHVQANTASMSSGVGTIYVGSTSGSWITNSLAFTVNVIPPPPHPDLYSATPNSGTYNGGENVVLAGLGFDWVDNVYFVDNIGTRAAAWTYDSDSQIQCTAPTGRNINGYTGAIYVQSNTTGSSNSVSWTWAGG